MESDKKNGPGGIPVLMGMKHSGKTTLGSLLAERIGFVFNDLDRSVEDLAEAETGVKRTFREIYTERGLAGFQRLEARALEITAQRIKTSAKAEVIALGGGTIENPSALTFIADLAVFLYLEEEEATLFERILAGGIPPFLKGGDPRQSFHELFEKRTDLFLKRADCVVKLHGLSPVEGVEIILRDLRRFHGRE